MKRKKRYLSICSFLLMLLLYLFHTASAMAAEKAALAAESAGDTTDILSTAKELTGWLESHKYTGGRARLETSVTLEEPYVFVPRSKGPELVVETGRFTILVSSEVELWSDGRLTFQGNGGGQSVFRVKKGGCLTLDGVNVECPSGQSALWQEEGAGFIVGDTFAKSKVTGTIHYAQKPFVMEAENACVIVKQGESVYGSFPTEVKCRVSRQGQCLVNEPVAVSWELTGTEEQQEKRVRFQAEGFFPEAESAITPVCTVVYDDYPLTFIHAETRERGGAYQFSGKYTEPEEGTPITAEVAYSFDGENWITDAEDTFSYASNGSYHLVFPRASWDTARYSHIYLRLQGERNGTEIFSNVLRFAADNLKISEDIGGGRGGGTSIVNPPSVPEEKPADSQTKEKQPFGEQSSAGSSKSPEGENLPEDFKSSEDVKSSDGFKQPDKYQPPESDSSKDKSSGSAATGRKEQPAFETGQLSQNDSQAMPDKMKTAADTAAFDNASNDRAMADNRKNEGKQKTAVMASSGAFGMSPHTDQAAGQDRNLIFAGGIALLAVFAGAAVYIWSGTKR